MKKYFTKQALYGFIVEAAFLLAACANPVTPPARTDVSTAPGTGQVRITVDLGSNADGAARTIYPAMVFDHYVYTFTKGGVNTVLTPTDGVFTLGTGSWTLAVQAYATAASGSLVATGSSSAFTVNEGQLTDNITVTLTPVVSSGQGTLSYTITYPVGTTLGTLTWKQLDGSATTDLKAGVIPSTTGSGTTLAGTKTAVSAGYYLITATLTDEYAHKTAGKSEAVHIYKNMTTDAAFTFTTDDFTATPFGLTAVIQSKNSIRLSWDSVPGAAGYSIYRGNSADTVNEYLDATGTTDYTAIGLSVNTVYYFRVSSFDLSAETEMAVVSARTSGIAGDAGGNNGPFLAPSGVTSAATSANSITVGWNSVTNAAFYEVYRGESSTGVYTLVSDVLGGTSYTDTGLEASTEYYYKVRSYTADGAKSSSLSTAASAVTLNLPAPASISAAVQSESSIIVTWDTVSGASGYNVYHAESTLGTYAKVNSNPVIGTSYTDTGLGPSTVYYYKVSAVNSSGTEGDMSVYDSAETLLMDPGLYDGAIDISHKIGTINSLAAASTYLSSNAETGHDYYIVLGQNESAAPISFSYPGKTVGVTIRGDTAERTITLNTNGSLFTVSTGVTLTLDEKITLVGKNANTDSLIMVNTGSTLVMNDGAKISGNTVSSSSGGGGVYINGGTFTMNGNASVSGNTASSSYSNSYSYGGGVYVSSGTFTMNGNTSVSNNTVSSSSSSSDYYYSYGGGVYVSSGTFTMNDNASVLGNTASSYSSYSSFYYYSYGGGVYVSSGTFIMNDNASVSGNTASSSYSHSYSYGGGVYVSYGGTFTMKSGTVYGSNGGENANRLEGSGTKLGVSLYKYSSATAKYGDGSPIIAGTQTQNLYTDATLTGHE